MNISTHLKAGLLAAAVLFCAQFGGAADGGPITAGRAKEIALAQTGGGEVVELELRRAGDGGRYYRIEIAESDGVYQIELDENGGRLRQFIRRQARDVPGAGTAGPDAPATAISPERALAIALAQTGGGTVVASDIETTRDGRVVYEFTIVNGETRFSLEIGGDAGDILEYKQKRRRTASPERSASRSGALSPRLTMEAAQTLAKERTGGGVVTEYKLDWEDGRLVHELEVSHAGVRYEIEIDDVSGDIVEFSLER